MKVTLNLALQPTRRERYALSWAAPLALLSAVGLVFIVQSAMVYIRDYRHIQEHTVQIQELNRKLAEQEKDLRKTVEQPEYLAVSGQAQYLNSLIEEKRFSVSDLVMRVGQLMPADVHLSAMSLKQSKGYVVSFSVVGRNEVALEEFLTALEDSPDFKDISVSSQGFQGQSDAEDSVTITCTARYVGSLVP
jgi:Fimbrial assembly protein (PilN)